MEEKTCLDCIYCDKNKNKEGGFICVYYVCNDLIFPVFIKESIKDIIPYIDNKIYYAKKCRTFKEK